MVDTANFCVKINDKDNNNKMTIGIITTRKVKYLNNKDLLAEIHKSKCSFSSFTKPEYQQYDIILPNLDKVNIRTIADAKRGDIGNTSSMYAKAFFEDLNFDSITVAPYMGSDSVEPFLAFKNKTTILLALTSNKGGLDFQGLKTENEELYNIWLSTTHVIIYDILNKIWCLLNISSLLITIFAIRKLFLTVRMLSK